MISPSQLSFLPDDYLERKARSRTNLVCAVLFLVVAGAIGSAFAISERSNRQVEQQWVAVNHDSAQAAQWIEQWRENEDKQRKIAHQAELSASLLEKVRRSIVLAEITNSLPAGVSLMDLTLESKSVQSKTAAQQTGKTAYELKKAAMEARSGTAATPSRSVEPTQYDVTLKLTGLAATDVQVSQLLTQLSRSPLFREVNLIVSDEHKQGDERMRKFQIEMTLTGEERVITQPNGQSAPSNAAAETGTVDPK